jgi:predicted dienelactone hydrolase
MKRLLPAVVLIAASCASAPNPNAPPPTLKVGNYSADAGPTPVGVIPTALLHDAQRNKDLDLSIEYPTRGGPFPLIVFSHGYGSSNQGYEPLISYWTSNGYVCIRPAHADAGALRDMMREAMTARRTSPRQRPQQQPQAQPPAPERNPMEEIWDREREPQWRNRVEDIKLVLNSLDELERRFPELRGKIDRSRIGVGGHSYGAFTTMLIAGMGPLQVADSRVKAAIAMSPQGVAANRGTTPESWAGVRIPIMYMTGTNDRGAGEGEDANWRKQAFDYSPAGDKYFVLIDGARHRSFVGGLTPIEPLESPRPPQPIPNPRDPYGRTIPTETLPQARGGVGFAGERRIFQIIKMTSLVFWDAYLKNEPSARELLQPQKFDASFGGATMTTK